MSNELFEDWEDRLSYEHGKFKLNEFENMLAEVNPSIYKDIIRTEFVNWVNNRDNGITITTSQSRNGTTYFVDTGQSMWDRYSSLLNEYDDEEQEVIMWFTGRGHQPRVIAATIDYLCHPGMDLDDAVDYHDVSKAGVQANKDAVEQALEEGVTVYRPDQ